MKITIEVTEEDIEVLKVLTWNHRMAEKVTSQILDAYDRAKKASMTSRKGR